MIYLDNAATTQTYKEVADLVAKLSVEQFYNPSSLYKPALQTRQLLNNARNSFNKMLGAIGENQVLFFASATEANNFVLNGFAKKNKTILISNGEHASINNTALNLINLGYDVKFIKLLSDGTLDIEDLKDKLNNNVCLVSIIHVNNETGAINDIKKISNIIKNVSKDIIFHCDGVQAFCKIDFELKNMGVDAYTISSHKIHGPKGVGALWLKNKLNPKPLILGGGQEFGLRSGTENVPGILGFEYAASIMKQNLDKNYKHISELRSKFIELLNLKCSDFIINAENVECVPNIISVSFLKVKGEVLLHLLEENEIYVSTGSACSSKHIGNRVLQSMNKSKEHMEGNIRFSFSENNTIIEIEKTVEVLQKLLQQLREINF